jgi:hypothetical protein
LEGWFELHKDTPVTMISLTGKYEGHNIRQHWDKLNRSKKLLLDLIRKYFPGVDYFWVAEPHKSGYAHYHLAVFTRVDNSVKDTKKQGLEDKFRELWSEKYKTGSHTYGLEFSYKEDDKKLKGLKNYLTKYLRKSFLLDSWTPEYLVWNAILWDSGYRSYGASKNLSAIMKLGETPQKGTVWLQTRVDDDECGERTIWGRQYIPDWLDSPFWLDNNKGWHEKTGTFDPPAQYTYTWGRKTTNRLIVNKIHWTEMNIIPRPHKSVYAQWKQ